MGILWCFIAIISSWLVVAIWLIVVNSDAYWTDIFIVFHIKLRMIIHLVGGLDHFLCFHILGIIIPIDFPILQRGGSTTNQSWWSMVRGKTTCLPKRYGAGLTCHHEQSWAKNWEQWCWEGSHTVMARNTSYKYTSTSNSIYILYNQL